MVYYLNAAYDETNNVAPNIFGSNEGIYGQNIGRVAPAGYTYENVPTGQWGQPIAPPISLSGGTGGTGTIGMTVGGWTPSAEVAPQPSSVAQYMPTSYQSFDVTSYPPNFNPAQAAQAPALPSAPPQGILPVNTPQSPAPLGSPARSPIPGGSGNTANPYTGPSYLPPVNPLQGGIAAAQLAGGIAQSPSSSPVLSNGGGSNLSVPGAGGPGRPGNIPPMMAPAPPMMPPNAMAANKGMPPPHLIPPPPAIPLPMGYPQDANGRMSSNGAAPGVMTPNDLAKAKPTGQAQQGKIAPTGDPFTDYVNQTAQSGVARVQEFYRAVEAAKKGEEKLINAQTARIMEGPRLRVRQFEQPNMIYGGLSAVEHANHLIARAMNGAEVALNTVATANNIKDGLYDDQFRAMGNAELKNLEAGSSKLYPPNSKIGTKLTASHYEEARNFAGKQKQAAYDNTMKTANDTIASTTAAMGSANKLLENYHEALKERSLAAEQATKMAADRMTTFYAGVAKNIDLLKTLSDEDKLGIHAFILKSTLDVQQMTADRLAKAAEAANQDRDATMKLKEAELKAKFAEEHDKQVTERVKALSGAIKDLAAAMKGRSQTPEQKKMMDSMNKRLEELTR